MANIFWAKVYHPVAGEQLFYMTTCNGCAVLQLSSGSLLEPNHLKKNKNRFPAIEFNHMHTYSHLILIYIGI